MHSAAGASTECTTCTKQWSFTLVKGFLVSTLSPLLLYEGGFLCFCLVNDFELLFTALLLLPDVAEVSYRVHCKWKLLLRHFQLALAVMYWNGNGSFTFYSAFPQEYFIRGVRNIPARANHGCVSKHPLSNIIYLLQQEWRGDLSGWSSFIEASHTIFQGFHSLTHFSLWLIAWTTGNTFLQSVYSSPFVFLDKGELVSPSLFHSTYMVQPEPKLRALFLNHRSGRSLV